MRTTIITAALVLSMATAAFASSIGGQPAPFAYGSTHTASDPGESRSNNKAPDEQHKQYQEAPPARLYLLGGSFDLPF